MVLGAIILATAIAVTINLFLTRWQIPTIIGYILTGVIVAYGLGLSHLSNDHTLNLIAEFGIVFLMFTIGLEFSIKHMMRLKREVFVLGSLQVFLSSLLFFVIGYGVLNLSAKESIIIASALSLSSTAVVLKLLNANGDISKPYGKNALGILIFQDLMVVPILLMISIFSSSQMALEMQIAKIIIGAIVLFALMWIVGRYLLEPVLETIVQRRLDELFVGAVLLVVLSSAYTAHAIGFTYSLGAFIAGMVIAETRYKHQVEADLIPFRDILLGIFFVTVGMQLDIGIITHYLPHILLLVVLIGILKAGVVFAIVRYFDRSYVAIKSALALFEMGEFGLVIFELADQRGLLTQGYAQILSAAVIISMILTPFLINQSGLIARSILDTNSDTNKHYPQSSELYNAVAVIGYGRLGKTICEKLEAQSVPYFVIDNDIHTVTQAQKESKPVYFANAAKKSVLESLGITQASSVIVALDNSEKVHRICTAIDSLKLDVPVIVKVDRIKEKEFLKNEFKSFHIVVGVEEVAQGMVSEALRSIKIEQPMG